MSRSPFHHVLSARARGGLIVAAAAALLTAGCSDDDDDPFPSFSVRTSEFNAVASAPVAIDGRFAVYLASEAETGPGGTDLNDDTDTADAVAVLVDLTAGTTRNLGVAARSVAVIDGEIYLVVSEAEDGDTDWDVDGTADDLVLLHMTPTGDPVFVDTLSGGPQPDIVVEEQRLWYRAAATPNAGETTLRYVGVDAPTTPVTVLAADPEPHVDVRPIRGEAGVLFCFLDEVADGGATDHNDDGDFDDTTIVALVDARADVPHVRNTRLGVASSATPMAARELPGGERLVAFLVSETVQQTNYNDLASLPVGWLPSQCDGTADDSDTTDDVLHWLRLAEWDLDPVADAPHNTGIAGRTRIVLFDGHVATLADETAQGAGCDFNASGGLGDTVARWVATTAGALPVQPAQLNLAVDTTTGGGASGFVGFEGRLLAAIDVTANDDQIAPLLADNLGGKQLLGWVDPATSSQWALTHRIDPTTTALAPVGVNWISSTPSQSRLGIGVDESVGFISGTTPPFTPVSLNSECAPISEAKDTDTTDTILGWVRFAGPSVLQLFGTGFALQPSSPGIVIASNHVFFRVSEAHHATDYNDGDLSDQILFRRPLGSCSPVAMSVLNSLVQPAILTEPGATGALLLLEELQTIGPDVPAGLDINDDGYVGGTVLRFFRF